MKKFEVKILKVNEIWSEIHFIRWDWNKARNYFKKHYWEYLDEFVKAEWFHFWTDAWKSMIYIKDESLKTIIHEVTHSIQYIFMNTNYIQFDNYMSEPLAYYISYYATEAFKFYKPKK